MENGNKKNSVLTSFWVGQSSAVLGAKLAALKPFYAWVARVAIVCIHVHPGIVIRRKDSAAGPITKLFAGGGGGEWRTCAMRDDEPRPVWMSPLITH